MFGFFKIQDRSFDLFGDTPGGADTAVATENTTPEQSGGMPGEGNDAVPTPQQGADSGNSGKTDSQQLAGDVPTDGGKPSAPEPRSLLGSFADNGGDKPKPGAQPYKGVVEGVTSQNEELAALREFYRLKSKEPAGLPQNATQNQNQQAAATEKTPDQMAEIAARARATFRTNTNPDTHPDQYVEEFVSHMTTEIAKYSSEQTARQLVEQFKQEQEQATQSQLAEQQRADEQWNQIDTMLNTPQLKDNRAKIEPVVLRLINDFPELRQLDPQRLGNLSLWAAAGALFLGDAEFSSKQRELAILQATRNKKLVATTAPAGGTGGADKPGSSRASKLTPGEQFIEASKQMYAQGNVGGDLFG